MEQPGSRQAGDSPEEGDAAAEAFERLRAEVQRQSGEIALVRRAMEGLAAERGGQDAPDYSETLGRMSQVLRTVGDHLANIEQAPALAMTPEQMGARVEAVAIRARDHGHAVLARASEEMGRVTAELRGLVASGRQAEEQRDRQWWFALGGAAIGALLWSFLPGLVAREVAPARWHWPERMAARTLRLPMWQAGEQLIAIDSPAGWSALVEGGRIVSANREAIDRCRKVATKAGDGARCTVRIGPER